MGVSMVSKFIAGCAPDRVLYHRRTAQRPQREPANEITVTLANRYGGQSLTLECRNLRADYAIMDIATQVSDIHGGPACSRNSSQLRGRGQVVARLSEGGENSSPSARLACSFLSERMRKVSSLRAEKIKTPLPAPSLEFRFRGLSIWGCP